MEEWKDGGVEGWKDGGFEGWKGWGVEGCLARFFHKPSGLFFCLFSVF
jgi:hypothetical protein